MTQWCEKVLSGLSQVQSVLGEDFDNASTTKALLYLQVLERSRHGGTPSRVHAFPESHPRYSTAKKMMEKYPPRVVVAAVKQLIEYGETLMELGSGPALGLRQQRIYGAHSRDSVS
ncbi:hypothetical protein RHOSPDRAFT_35837 [Rhodotorula sp. JG-1b]|nr:hypothetical protein RHOSPDRAFT_35837 [Rhodotorula sp. JG-1b]